MKMAEVSLENLKHEVILPEDDIPDLPHDESSQIERTCSFCDVIGDQFTFLDSTALEHHLHETHGMTEKKVCSMCFKISCSAAQLRRHVQEVHDGVRHFCTLCTQTFARKFYLNAHVAKCHGDTRKKKKGNVCQHCLKQYATPNMLRRHEQEVHKNLRYPCKICLQSFTRKYMLRMHVKKSHPGEEIDEFGDDPIALPYTLDCKFCDIAQTFLNVQALDEHIQAEHQDKRNICPHCPKEFANESLLKRHSSETHLNVRHLCAYCPQKFVRKYSLKVHMDKKHPNEVVFISCEPKVVSVKKQAEKACSTCGKKFKNSKRLKRHLDYVHGEKGKQFECETCGKRLYSESMLTDHINSVHLKIKKFQCLKCNRKYYWRSSLEKHVFECNGYPLYDANGDLVREPQEPVTCISCNLKFKDIQSMRKHVAETHPEVKVFKCDLCELIFSKDFYLAEHKHNQHKVETENQQSVCPVCQRTYSGIGMLKLHMSVVHPETSEQGLSVASEQLVKPGKEEVDHEEEEGKMEKRPCYKSCYICASEFEQATEFDMHMINVHHRTFFCDLCNNWYLNEESLKSHIKKSHSIDTWLQCEICDYKERTKTLMLAHFKDKHRNIDEPVFTAIDDLLPSKCETCQQSFANECDFDDHKSRCKAFVVKAEKLSSQSCDLCGKDFCDLDQYLVHMKSLHNKAHVCSECFACFQTPQSLKKHRKKVHNFVQKYQCDICLHITKSVFLLTHHQKKKHSDKGAADLKYSIIKEANGPVNNQQVECKICGKISPNAAKNRAHVLAAHEKFKNYECTQCTKQFGCKKSLNKHNLNYHNGSSEFSKLMPKPKSFKVEKPLSCPICDVGFSSSKPLNRHIKSFHPQQSKDFVPFVLPAKGPAHPERPMKCQVCGNGYLSDKYRKKHVKKNHPEVFDEIYAKKSEFFECTLCSENNFSDWSSLVDHCSQEHPWFNMEEHPQKNLPAKCVKEKSFKCNLCEKSFKGEAWLNNHVRKCHSTFEFVNEGQFLEEDENDAKPVQVPVSRPKNFKCHYCCIAYSSQLFLDRHVRKAHAISNCNEIETDEVDPLVIVKLEVDDE